MSEVRMCDRCGRVFSLREEGWQQLTVQQKETGRHEFAPALQGHLCGRCTIDARPLAVEAPKSSEAPDAAA